MTPRVVLVTGVSRYLAAHTAARLAADPSIHRVVGTDATAPSDEITELIGRTEFVRADVRSPVIADVIAEHEVDTVVHMAVVAAPSSAGGRQAMKEQNVIGTMQLLAACQRAGAVRRLVVRSSVAAYGASPRDPAIFTEATEPRGLPRGGYAKDVAEIEGYVRGFRRRRPDMTTTVLRFAPFVGSRADTTLTRYFSLPLVPTVLGRDPRIQFVHIDDALDVLYRAAVEDHPGDYNVAGPGVLLLSQAVRRAGRVPVPVPDRGMALAAGLAKRSGLIDFSLDQLDFLVYGRVVDVSRLIGEFGYQPRSTREAFDDFIGVHTDRSVLNGERLSALERLVLDRYRAARGDGKGDR